MHLRSKLTPVYRIAALLPLVLLLIFPTDIRAQINASSCQYFLDSNLNETESSHFYGEGRIRLHFQQLDPNENYQLRLRSGTAAWSSLQGVHSNSQTDIVLNIPSRSAVVERLADSPPPNLPLTLELIQFNSATDQTVLCNLGTVNLSDESLRCEFRVSNTLSSGEQCYGGQGNYCLEAGQPLRVEATATHISSGEPASNRALWIVYENNASKTVTTNQQGVGVVSFDSTELGLATFRATLAQPETFSNFSDVEKCQGTITVSTSPSCRDAEGNLICSSDDTPLVSGTNPELDFELCQQISNSTLRSSCETCSTSNGVWTAVGCIETTAEAIVEKFITLGVGLGGGIALLTMVASGFILTTSQGDPQRANQAKEMMTAAVVGLLFIVFSVVILQFIGVTILKIPGFGA